MFDSLKIEALKGVVEYKIIFFVVTCLLDSTYVTLIKESFGLLYE